MPHLVEYINRRREIAQLYHEGLWGSKKVIVPAPPLFGSNYYDTYNSYVIRVVQRGRLIQFLEKMGVEVLVSWRIPLHLQESLGLEHYKGKLPITERVSNEVVSLPIYPQMTNEQVHYVINCIREFYG